MHENLRRRALESGKTVSKKSQSRQSSRTTSAANSRPNSRPASRAESRNVSDDEDGSGNLSDEMSLSTHSIDDLLTKNEFDDQPEVQRHELKDRVEELCDRKGRSFHGREETLASYVHILTGHHLADELGNHVSDLIPAFFKSIKAQTTERETVLALRAVALTIISVPDEVGYEEIATQLKRTISDSQSLPVKAAAIHCLGTSVAFGTPDDAEIWEALSFLLEIVSSDGSFVDAADDVETVLAAIQEYGFLATFMEDLEAESEDAVATFADQLDSDNANIQIAAGQNIALLFEKQCTPVEEDESPSDVGEGGNMSSSEDLGGSSGPALKKRYDAYHNTSEILDKVQALASLTSRKINKHDRRQLHESFWSIGLTVENPKLGPRTRDSSRMTIQIHQRSEMKINKWWKLLRLNKLRRVLQGGFVNHYFEGNSQVLDALPVLMIDPDIKANRVSKASKGKYKGSPRRAILGAEEC